MVIWIEPKRVLGLPADKIVVFCERLISFYDVEIHVAFDLFYNFVNSSHNILQDNLISQHCYADLLVP